MPYSPAHIHKTKLCDLTPEDMVWLHISSNVTPCEDFAILSTLGATLAEHRSARAHSNTEAILPILATFAIFDQIGSTYERKSKPSIVEGNVSGVKRGLYHFADLDYSSPDVKALYALRNAMTHDASIVDRGRSGNGPYYRFAFDKDLPTLLRHPDTAWDGTWGQAPYTKINRSKLYQLAETAVSNLKQAFMNDDLDLRIGHDQIFDCYLLTKSREELRQANPFPSILPTHPPSSS